MLATDANGLPLATLTTSAGVSEVRMADATLVTTEVPPRKGERKSRQSRLVMRYTEEYRRRWPVERTLVRLGHQRKVLVRHEHKAANFHAFSTLTCIRLALKASVQCARL